MDKAKWKSLVAGDGCPMDAPREPSTHYWDLVPQPAVSSLYLTKRRVPLDSMPDTRLPSEERDSLIHRASRRTRRELWTLVMPVVPRTIPGMPRTFFIRATRHVEG